MKTLIAILNLLIIYNSALAQNVAVAKDYICSNGFKIRRGDTIFLNQPKGDYNTYKSIFKPKSFGKNNYLTKDAGETYLVVERIARYFGGSPKEYAYLKSDGLNVKNYTIDIENAIINDEVVIPDGFTPEERQNLDKNSYYASNGIVYRIGDTVTLGMGSAPNGDFRYLNIGGWASILMYNSNEGSEQFDIGRSYAGLNVIIKAINYYKFKGAKKVFFTVGGGNITNYRLSIEEAISTCEVVPCKKDNSNTVIQPFSKADEIKKMHELKEQGILTEEEFQQQKNKLLEK